MERMTAYVGRNGASNPVPVEVERVGAGAGRVTCFECGGDGNWGKFAPEMNSG